jgi:Rrf2 family protein
LRKSGLVKSIRGSLGGYVLADQPDKITVGAVLRALEGSLAPVDCVVENDPANCERSACCVTKMVWEKIRDSINDVVDSITLQDLTEEYKKYNKNDEYMFYI